MSNMKLLKPLLFLATVAVDGRAGCRLSPPKCAWEQGDGGECACQRRIRATIGRPTVDAGGVAAPTAAADAGGRATSTTSSRRWPARAPTALDRRVHRTRPATRPTRRAAAGRHRGRLDVARRQDQADVRHAVRRRRHRPSSTTSSAAWTPRTIRGWRYRDASRGMNLGEDMVGAKPNAAVANGENVGFSTAFPVSMARGAAFDLDLEYAIGEAIGDEMQAAKETLLLAPCMNLLRHPLLGPRAGDLRRGPVPHRPPRHRDDRGRAAAHRRQRQALHGVRHRDQPRRRTTRSWTSRRCARSTAATSGWSSRTAASRR